MSSVSILILTLNEERNIADCIDSCRFSDDIVVFDSYSSDRTPQLAAEKGARFHQRAFDNYAAQRNAALTGVTYKHPWVLMVDADERVTAALATEISGAVARARPDVALFRMRRKDYFMGRWLKRSSGYPSWFGRLVRIGRVRVEREVNEEYIAEGAVVHLEEHLLHYPFNKGVEYWLARHNRYSGMEAAEKLQSRDRSFSIAALFSSDPIMRRRGLKRLAYRLPLRPLLVFMYLFVVRRGFMDGRAGFYFCCMRASYEFFIDLKVIEAERARTGLPV